MSAIKTWIYGSSLLLMISMALPAQAQILYSTGYTADEMAAYLAGDGVEIDNAVVNCYSLAFGKFDCVDCNVGLDSGIVLTSGRVSNIAGPNNSGSTGTNNGWPGDADLDAYPGVGTTHDACTLEFDVYSPGDSLSFTYVFGSDEYPEYVGSINDAFVFWISGPGFPTPTNIALIPGTVLPVTIDNINAGSYPMYYVPNGTGGVGIWATDPYYIEYDGFTTPLIAAAEVTPCEWYHLKLTIADESDFVWDSGVFIGAKSLITNYLADFTFPGFGFGVPSEFCTTDPDPVPVYAAGAAAGHFDATPIGLVFNDTTGVIDLSASNPGTYEFTNTLLTGYCYGDTAVFSTTITITAPPNANFHYLASGWCVDEPDPTPVVFPGALLGTFTAAPAGLVINPATGTIDLSASLPGTYTVTNTVLGGGCPDGVDDVIVNIYPTYTSSTNAEICDGDVYVLPDGTNVTTAGTYTTILPTIHGCDSTITTTLIVHPVYNTVLNPAICAGGSYILPDGTVTTTAGTYTYNYATVFGCDSNIVVNLSVNTAPTINMNAQICSGDVYTLPDGTTATTAGLYTVTLTTGAGCDSIINTNLIVWPVFASTVNATICDDDTYTLPDGSVVNTTGTYVSNFLSVHGCDSVITTNLTVNPTYQPILNPEICIGESYTLPDGTDVYASGTWNFPYTTVSGCDSLVTVNLTVHPLPVLDWVIDDIICTEQSPFALDATPAGGIYSGTGIAGTNFLPDVAGVGGPYTLTYDYTDIYGCSNSISVETSVDENFASAWGDTTVYYGETAQLHSNAGGDYSWSPGEDVDCPDCPDVNVVAPYTLTYIMTSVNGNGCIASDGATITVLPDPGNIMFVPNTFTPNGDNVNDYFFVYGYNFILISRMDVYDRWGELVFSAENVLPGDVTKGWDGTFNGQPVNNGVYAFVVQVLFETGQQTSSYGNVTLIR